VGWDAERFTTTLRFYQAGARTNPVMVSVARSLDEDQVAALAAYYGSLPKPAPKAKK
jgi:cytochrome c553